MLQGQPKRSLFKLWVQSLLLVVWFSGCGGAGSAGLDEDEGGTVVGAITGTDGSQGGLAGWFLVMTERNSGVSRVSMVNSAGLYEFRGVKMGAAQTLILLSPAFKRTAVLAITPKVAQTIRQFFMPNSQLPPLVHNGKIMTFSDESLVSITDDMAADSDEDLIPEGLDPVSGLRLSGVDQDTDGVPNASDPDIDGDGLINWFDDNDDADNNLDIFDQDVDGTFVIDTVEGKIGDQFFTDCIEYFAVQVFTDSAASETSMKFATKLRSGCGNGDIRIRGAPSLFSGAEVRRLNEVEDADGNVTETMVSGVWDLTLKDEGVGGDGNANDGVYGEVVYLQTGMKPSADSVVFLQVGHGSTANPWYKEYPFIFPDINMSSYSVTYDSSVRRVTMVGDPFGTNRDYIWYAEVIDSEDQVLWRSDPIQGTSSKSLTIGTTDVDFVSGEVYEIRASAQSLDRIPSRPAYVVKSSAYEYTVP